ncbi:MAG: MmgE/PrpD family protein [Deltaproteobacteria bacterium]|nr:MmgE/PrpD family protein [Deltaproteobacteria bacterium]
MYTTEILAEFALAIGPEDISVSMKEAAKRCILDLLGAAWAGHGSESATALHRMVQKNFGPGKSAIWFTGIQMTASAAALANAASASALDLDDGHRGAAGHPGASIIPAVFAVAQEVGASDGEILTAIIVGYEIACRVGAARDFSRLPTLSTGRWCAYGAAAATARLRRLPAQVLAQALAIAGSQVPDLAASGYSRVMGNHVKEGIPWATLLGIVAVDLAQEGFTGPLDILDHPDYFNPDQIMAMPPGARAIENIYFKPYSSCRWSHAAIDALVSIIKENDLAAKDIGRVTVETFERALRLNNYSDPSTLESAQYSIPFCLGVAAVKGPATLLPLTDSSLHDADIVNFAGRVTLTRDAGLNDLFPRQTPARVKVETTAGTIEKTVTDPRGDPANPMTRAELEAKFRCLTHPFLTADQQRQIVASVMAGKFLRRNAAGAATPLAQHETDPFGPVIGGFIGFSP